MVEGRIQTRSWDDKSTGEKKYRTEIVADSVQFGAKAGGTGFTGGVTGGASSDASTGSPAGASGAKASGAKAVDTIDYPTDDINPEDIPF